MNDEPSTELLWYVRPPDGGEYGPAETPLMETWLAEGRIGATALVWRTGWSEWQEASSVFPQLAVAESTPVEGGHAAAPPAPPVFTNTPLPSPKSPATRTVNPSVNPVLPDGSGALAGVQGRAGGSEPNGSVAGGGSIRPGPAPTPPPSPATIPPAVSSPQMPSREMAPREMAAVKSAPVKSAPVARAVPAARAEGRYRRKRGDRKSWWVTAVIFLGLTAAALLVTLLVVLMNQTAG